jgi:hypothetical protein
VAHFRVIASEVAFGVNFLAISLETLGCAQQLTKLFMFLYQKGVRSQKCSHQVALSAVHWQIAPLHQPLSPTTSSVVPPASSSPHTLFPERHFWCAVRTSTLATVLHSCSHFRSASRAGTLTQDSILLPLGSTFTLTTTSVPHLTQHSSTLK